MKNAYERFLEEICSNCKDKERKNCEIRKRIDRSIKCNLYKKSEEENIWKDV